MSLTLSKVHFTRKADRSVYVTSPIARRLRLRGSPATPGAELWYRTVLGVALLTTPTRAWKPQAASPAP